MLWLRKIVFYIFALIYLVLCPLIVARMLGFVIDPLTHRLVKTGLIYISTNPPDAAVYIDGRWAPQKTPTVIRDLTAGKHFVRIQLDDYNDWERNIPVIAKKATVLANILLIPEAWPIKRISPRPYQDILLADDDILIATNPLLKNIDIFHTTAGIKENLFSHNSIYADGRLAHVFNDPPSHFILIEANIKDKHKFLWINLKENPPLIKDLSDLFAKIPSLIAWNNADQENIFAFYPDHVDRINIKNKAIFPQNARRLPKNLRQHPVGRVQEKFLINDGNDLLTRQGAWIRIYPKEDFGTPRAYDIAKSKPSTNMYFEEKNGELFYLEDGTGFLSTARILTYHTILNIPVPEALRTKISNKEPDL